MPTRAAVLAAALLLSAAAPLHAQAPRAQVMILGTYHMDNPGQDYVNATADDVLAPHRQAEIDAVARALAEFRPTRIAIEAEPRRDSVWNARYQAYRRGQHALTRDEREQLGFRLAGLLGHDRVYPVDYKLDMDVGGVMRFAAQNGQGELAQRMGATVQAVIADMNARMAATPVGAILAEANGARADSMHGWYLVMATVGRDTSYAGARGGQLVPAQPAHLRQHRPGGAAGGAGAGDHGERARHPAAPVRGRVAGPGPGPRRSVSRPVRRPDLAALTRIARSGRDTRGAASLPERRAPLTFAADPPHPHLISR